VLRFKAESCDLGDDERREVFGGALIERGFVLEYGTGWLLVVRG